MRMNIHGKIPEKEADTASFRKPTPIMLMGEIGRIMGSRLHDPLPSGVLSQKSARWILMELAKRDGRTQLELAKATHLKAPTVSVLMQKLERENIVRRETDSYDMRVTRVFLTEKGRELDRNARKRMYEEDEKALAVFTPEERETLEKLLLKLRGHLIASETKEEESF